MTTDRELLEFAAKAAGMWPLPYWEDGRGFGVPDREWWNPLTDDGDALRLAVKLWLEVDICQTGIAVRTPNGIKVLLSEDDEPDVTAATRRAIVRAAAEIGKAMP